MCFGWFIHAAATVGKPACLPAVAFIIHDGPPWEKEWLDVRNPSYLLLCYSTPSHRFGNHSASRRGEGETLKGGEHGRGVTEYDDVVMGAARRWNRTGSQRSSCLLLLSPLSSSSSFFAYMTPPIHPSCMIE